MGDWTMRKAGKKETTESSKGMTETSKETKNLQQYTEEWMQLERKTLEQRKEAELFYDENLMKLIEEEFIRSNRNKVTEKVDYLIISVGTSYEPLVLSIRLFQPQKILFLYTDLTETILNKIVSYCELDMTSFQKRRVHETNPIDIYREIKHAYLEWGRPQKLYIDFTGGTKSMSAAAAMAGAVIDVQMVYVGTSNYLADFRKPYPGSETLFYIDNPLSIFGDLEVEKAMVLFAQNNYSAAREKLEVLKEQIPDPNLRQQLNFAWLLASMYERWDALEFVPAYEAALSLEQQLKRDSRLHRTFLLMDCREKIESQCYVLEKLREIPGLLKEKRNYDILCDRETMLPLMFTMYMSALIREKQEKYDMATLLMYRLLEMVEQRRIATYGLYISKMVYEKVEFRDAEQLAMNEWDGPQKREWLKTEVFEIRKKLFPRTENKFLPDQISLLDGFTLLAALKDPIFGYGAADPASGKESADATVGNENAQAAHRKGMPDPVLLLKRIRSMVYLRNNSIFAHGLGPVAREDYLKFRRFVEDMFRTFCAVEDVSFDDCLAEVTWIDPTKTAYYSKLEV